MNVTVKYKWLQTLYLIDDYSLIHSDSDYWPANVYQTSQRLNVGTVSSTNDPAILETASDNYLMSEPCAAVSDSHCRCDSVALDTDRMMALMIQLSTDFVGCDKMIGFDCG